MRIKSAILCLALCTPAIAQDGQRIISMSPEDEATCAEGCAMITKAALDVLQARMASEIRRADEMEAIANRLANELRTRPGPKFCL